MSRQGDVVRTDWQRVLRSGRMQSGTYELPCDGTEHATGGETMSCTVVSGNERDGWVRTPGHRPPVIYSTSTVDGDALTVRSYGDKAHTQPVATLVYDRDTAATRR